MDTNLRVFSSPTHPPFESTDPETVMVVFGDAHLALGTVFGPEGLERVANFAVVAVVVRIECAGHNVDVLSLD